jgi:hypothetical protein
MTTLAELLRSSTKRHRAAVAERAGLASDAPPGELLASLLDPGRLARIAAEDLGANARGLALRAVLEPGAARLTGGPRADLPALGELEHHGLAFAFGEHWWREYRIPDDLRGPLRRALVDRHCGAVAEAKAERWVGVPQQTLHDAAALSALMARDPVRVKADGDLYSRAWPALERALPPLPLSEDGFDGMRIDLALSFLRQGGFLRLRVDDVPGATIRRELVPAGDLGATLREPPGALREQLLAEYDYGVNAAAATLADGLAGRAASLESFGEALAALLGETGWAPYRHLDARSAALTTLGPLWLAGAIELGVGTDDRLVAARPRASDGEAAEPVPANGARPAATDREPDDRQEAGAASVGVAPSAVCQANFEVVQLRPPSPADRLVLELCCERSVGQEHVLRLTRASVRCGERALRATGGVREALGRLVGELPQNVERSLADWTAGVKGPLRLRTAMMVEAPDEQAADELEAGALNGLCVERLGPRLLAVPGDALARLGRSLTAAGEELEPGLDRISGSWREPHNRSDEAEYHWLPYEWPEHTPPGKQVSTLGERASRAARSRNGAAASEPGAASATATASTPASAHASASSPALDDPIVTVLCALEEGTDVHIRYAGARGLTERQVTPFEVDDARLHAWCHLREDERAFWLSSIQAAVPVG